MSMLFSSRSVVLLSDEGVSVFDMTGGRVQPVETIGWDVQGFEDALSGVITRHCRGRSILILNDMVEQHYRKERVPKASSLDKAGMVKRRTAAAFPSYPIRSSVKLKEKAPVRDGTQSGEVYLLAAVPLSDNIKKVLGGIEKSHASIAGFCLLPVESSGLVQALSKKLAKRSAPSTWSVLVGQHSNGGLRQIVTKNGELALTRMTPLSVSDLDRDMWVSEIVSELKGTMSYLSRFGFNPSDGLDVVVISNSAAAENLVAKVDFNCNLSVLSNTEAANLLGLKIGSQDDQRFADPIHVAWSAKKSSFTMPLQATQISKVSGPAQMAMAASILLFAGCCYFGYNTFTQAAIWRSDVSQLSQTETNLVSVRQQHADEIAKKKELGIDYLLIETATKVYDKLEKGSMKPLGVFDLIGRSLGTDIRIASLDVKAVDVPALDPNAPPVEGAPAQAELKPKEFEIVLKINFPAELEPERGVQAITELEKRLKENLPQHSVSIIKQVADLSYTGNFVGEATQSGTKTGQGADYEAQIMIKGALL